MLVEAFTNKEITSFPNPAYTVVCIIWGIGAAFIGLKGIKYVARVATYLPLIPLITLLVMFFRTGTSSISYTPPTGQASTPLVPMLGLVAYIVGFFATAGAAGVDFGLNSRNAKDVNRGGLVGIALAIVVAAGLSLIAVAGAHVLRPDLQSFVFTDVMKQMLSQPIAGNFTFAGLFMIGLAIASIPPACFSSFIAANSFKTTLPKVNPFITVGLGAIFSIVIAVFGWAGKLAAVFGIIGASFGPICGAIVVEYFIEGRKWPGPRAGFNPAGWVAWLIGFIIGILPNPALTAWGITREGQFAFMEPAPILAFVAGAVVFYLMAKAGLQSRVIPIETEASEQA
jgi:cytosine permease